jgi:serine/threonine protein phosphatase 1
MVTQTLTYLAPGWLSPNLRIYAIGDVHGCDVHLAALHILIEGDMIYRPVAHALIIHLGDYIDRGPRSAAVVRSLIACPTLAGVPVINLRGNHEQMMIDALLGDPGDVMHWRSNGGDATLKSWGITPSSPVQDWLRIITPDEEQFLHKLPHYHQIDGYVFVHAGLRPGVELERQSFEDMLWIRQGFLDHAGPVLPGRPDIAVVHGHTPEAEFVLTAHRLGIDTGAVMGGRLTCAVLQDRTVRFLAA